MPDFTDRIDFKQPNKSSPNLKGSKRSYRVYARFLIAAENFQVPFWDATVYAGTASRMGRWANGNASAVAKAIADKKCKMANWKKGELEMEDSPGLMKNGKFLKT